MPIFKCKMCGGALILTEGQSTAECIYCGTTQTLPRLDDDRKANLYDRANHFRRNNDFDKAMGIYETILNEDNIDAEAYWSLVLCRYGIEYVEDPATRRRIPTVNRAQFTSIFADEDYKSAIKYADSYQRSIYEEEAAAIDEIQRGILAISQKEEPFDVFISYKETDTNGRRTPDSVLATDLYHQLTNEGFRVFLSRITLEDKLGTAYEPYIFAALNSSKVMVALGTKPEHFNAVWVKNEWSRYLALIKSGAKKTLIPAFRDMDPYDLPEEFSHLQAQDMSKLGFMQDLIRGIKKILSADKAKAPVIETKVVETASANTAPFLRRAFMFLEDGNWESADEYCEKVLDQDPENAKAYLGKLMAELKVRRQSDLKDRGDPFDWKNNYDKVMRFGDDKLKAELQGYINYINERNNTEIYEAALEQLQAAVTEEECKAAEETFVSLCNFRDSALRVEECQKKAKECIYSKALKKMESSYTEGDCLSAAKIFRSISGFNDADAKANECLKDAENYRKDKNYDSAAYEQSKGTIESLKKAIGIFASITGWEDADERIEECKKKIEEIKAKEEARRLEAERRAEEHRIAAEKAAKKKKLTIAITTPIIIACIAFLVVLTKVIIPNNKYNAAVELMNEGKYCEAITEFSVLGGYKDSSAIKARCETENLKVANIGDYIVYGSYEQDNNIFNGKENIEWLVLDKQDNAVLVISKYALNCQQYNTQLTIITWETCSLRPWLNNTFLNKAFSKEEQAKIQTTNITADKNPKYSTDSGNATNDKVFLLSTPEAEKYFTTDEARKCAPTEYAIAQGAWTSDKNKTASGEATCKWWLRSPGTLHFLAASVNDDGSVNHYGHDVNYDLDCVRPAFWINLDS